MARLMTIAAALAACALLAPTSGEAKTLAAGTASQYTSAMQSAVAGDTVQLTADISVPCDTIVKAGTTLDLNGHRISFPATLPDGRPSRGLSVEGGAITVMNGTIDNGKWAIYAFKAAAGFTFRNLKITRTLCFLKLGAGGEGITSRVRIDGVDIQCDDNPWTIVDLGPGAVSDVQIRNLTSVARITDNNTGSDGIGIETALDPVTIENVKIDGCSGDAFDIKGSAVIRDCVATNAARQSFKVWGNAGVASEFTRCVAYNNGQGGMANAGIITMTDCYLEAGRNNDTAFFWGVGKTCGGTDHWGNPDTYGCGGVTATVTRCQFIRHGGASVLLTAETGPYRPAEMRFTDCTFYNPGHPNLYVGPNFVLVDQAAKGQWPSNFVNCKYLDVAAPGGATATTSSPSPLTLKPMARSCLVELNIDTAGGGTPPSASVIEWRTPGGTWKKAQPLTRVMNDYRTTTRPPTPLMATIILGLEEGQTYEVRATLTGAGYAGTPSSPQTFTTLTSTPPSATGAVIPVTVDENTTTAQVYGAINAALSATDPAANAGKVVEIRSAHGPGVRTVVRAAIAAHYAGAGGYWKWSGTPNAWLTLRVAPGHNVIFEGSNPAYDTTGKDLWEPYTDDALGITPAHGIFRTKSTLAQPWVVYVEETPDDIPARLPDVTSGRSWQTFGNDSRQYSTGLATLKERAAAGEYAFAYHTDNRVYLRLPGGADPDTVRVKFPGIGSCLDIGLSDSSPVRNVVVEGLRIQNFMGSSAAYMASGGLGAQACDGIVFRNCDVRGCVEYLKPKSSAGLTRNNIVVKSCLFREKFHADRIAWYHYKYSVQENVAVNMTARCFSMLDTTVQGVFNGWSSTGTQPGVWDGSQTSCSEAVEIDGCTFEDIGDDAIEPEQFGIGFAFTRNVFRRCYKGVSMAPVSGGPVYVVRNIWHGRGEFARTADKQVFTKFGNDDPGDTAYKLCANNTVVNLNDDEAKGKVLVGLANSGKTLNAHIWNNYVSSDGFSIDFGYGSVVPPFRLDGNVYRQRRPTVNLPAIGSSGAPVGTQISPPVGQPGLDGRLATQYWYYMGLDRGAFAVVKRSVNDPGETTAEGGNRCFSSDAAGFAAWQKGTPNLGSAAGVPFPAGDWLFDPHSHFYTGSHELVDPAGGDFRPVSGSTAIGAGQHLDNITRDVGPGWAAVDESSKTQPTAGALLAGEGITQQTMRVSVTGPTAGTTGQPVSGTFTVTGTGGALPTVEGTVTTPSGVSPLTLTTSTWSFTPAEAGSHTVSITARTASGQANATHVVSVAGNGTTKTGEITVVYTTSPAKAKPGETVTVTLTALNATDRTVTAVTVVETLPRGLRVVAGSARLDGAAVTLNTDTQGRIVVPLGDMAPGTTHTLSLQGVIE